MRVTGASTSPSRDAFGLYGFDNLLNELDEALASVHVRHSEPQVAVVEDAVFVPATKVRAHQFAGAVLTADGQPIPRALANRRLSHAGDIVLGALTAPEAMRPEQVIEEEVVYLGWYFVHFGHFLLESLARTWVLPAVDPATKVLFHTERGEEPSGSTLQMLELLGVRRERMLFPKVQTTLRRVIVPEPLYEVAHAAHVRMPEPHRRIAAALMTDEVPSEQPVYLSRRLLSSSQRPIIGELELEEVMRENGFFVAHPETMSLADQINLVNGHRDIFTSAGSAAYLALFPPEPPRLHLLTAGVPFPDYFLIPAVAGIETTFVNCLGAGHRPAEHYLPQLADFESFSGYLDSIGLLEHRLRSSLVSLVLDLRPVYDESWLYKYIRHLPRTASLPADLEAEAVRLAATSWPLSWILAHYYAMRHPERVEPLVLRVIALLAAESDIERLAHYRDDSSRRLGQILRHCSPETAPRLKQVLDDRLLIEEVDDDL